MRPDQQEVKNNRNKKKQKIMCRDINRLCGSQFAVRRLGSDNQARLSALMQRHLEWRARARLQPAATVRRQSGRLLEPSSPAWQRARVEVMQPKRPITAVVTTLPGGAL
jgi:hypothetical protein